MPYQTEKSIFHHIQKTGGTWVKKAMQRAGLHSLDVHYNYRTKPKHPSCWHRVHITPKELKDTEGLFSFCFIRHPVSWYKSFWSMRYNEEGVNNTLYKRFPSKDPLEYNWDKDINVFISKMLDEFPNGYLTDMFHVFIDCVDFVGRQEDLENDLVTALNMAGEAFDENRLRSTLPQNVGKNFTDINPELFSRVVESEQIIREYYANNRYYTT